MPSPPAFASGPIGYISSASGYILRKSGSTAVTAKWSGRAPIGGITGYGKAHQMIKANSVAPKLFFRHRDNGHLELGRFGWGRCLPR